MDEKSYTIETTVDEDGSKAQLQVVPREGAAVDNIALEDLLNSLHEAGVVHGIREDVLKELVMTKTIETWTVVAEGTPPVPGQDGEVIFHFSKEKPTVRLQEDATGHVNLWDLNLIQNVKQGDLLCELTPPEAGTPGKTVKGDILPTTDGAPAVMPKAQNAEISADGTQLSASVSGMVMFDGEKVVVEHTYTVDKVDASTGNIRFIGSVVVNGEVGDGFEVQAGEDLTIAMSVGHVVLSAGRDVKLSGGIIKGTITAGRDISAKFIQDAEVTVQGSVIVEDYIQNSEVIAEGPVAIKNPAGWIMGGTVSSEQWIYTQLLGKADASANTTVIIGSHPNLANTRNNLEEEIFRRIEEFQQFRSSLLKMRAIKAKGQITPKQEQLYQKIVQAIHFVRNEMLSKQQSVDAIIDRINRAYSGEIYAAGAAYGGTTIQIGARRKVLEVENSSVKFALVDGQIQDEAFTMRKEIEEVLGK